MYTKIGTEQSPFRRGGHNRARTCDPLLVSYNFNLILICTISADNTQNRYGSKDYDDHNSTLLYRIATVFFQSIQSKFSQFTPPQTREDPCNINTSAVQGLRRYIASCAADVGLCASMKHKKMQQKKGRHFASLLIYFFPRVERFGYYIIFGIKFLILIH